MSSVLENYQDAAFYDTVNYYDKEISNSPFKEPTSFFEEDAVQAFQTEKQKRQNEESIILDSIMSMKKTNIVGNSTIYLNTNQFANVHKLMEIKPPVVSIRSNYRGLERDYNFEVPVRGANCSNFLGSQKTFRRKFGQEPILKKFMRT